MDGKIVEETIDDNIVVPKRRNNKTIVNVAEDENASKRSYDSIMPPEHVLNPLDSDITSH